MAERFVDDSEAIELEEAPLSRPSAAQQDEIFVEAPPTNRRPIIISTAVVAVVLILIVVLIVIMNLAEKKDSPQKILFGHVSPDRIKALLKNFSTRAHIAGSDQDRLTAEWARAHFEGWGYKTTVDEIPVMLSYPSSRRVEVVFPPDQLYNCTLEEDGIPTGNDKEPAPVDTWNGYSASGEARGQLVYANYGREEDYEALERIGVNVSGKIVIVRYGKIFRGNKALGGYKRGAVGLIIYVDPADTGNVKAASVGEEVYPKGPWSSNTTVQRGSVYTGAGDPSTPGWPSTAQGPRLSAAEAHHHSEEMLMVELPNIPIQPIGYADAVHLLKGLNGSPIPDVTWAGGFNMAFVGPGPVEVYMKINASFPVVPIWNVIASLRGQVEPDRYVLIGCHRDAWTYGAADPISGHSVLLELARAVSELYKGGWRPKRTIIFFSWDAEEYSLIGSVEYVERRMNLLQARALAYLNLDVAVSGTEAMSSYATPSLFQLIREAASEVPLPPTQVGAKRSLWDINAVMEAPGSGSDHTPFAHHAGIPVVYNDLADKEGKYSSVYHSNYDSFDWMSRFGDPTFEYHAAMTKFYGAMLLRLCDDRVVPLNFTDYARHLDKQILILKNDTSLNTTQLSSAVDLLRKAYAETMVEAADAYEQWLYAVNSRLALAERGFVHPEVSAPRPCHVIWSPSPDDSYAGGAFASVYSAFNTNLSGTHSAQFLIARIAQIIESVADSLAPDVALA